MIEQGTLKESKLFLSKLFDSMTPGVFIVDRKMFVRHFNRSFANLFSLKAQDPPAKKCGNLIGCTYAEDENVECLKTTQCQDCELNRVVSKSFSLKDQVQSGILERMFRINGELHELYFHYTSQSFFFQGARYVVMVLDDISEEQRHRKELERANKRLKELNEFKNSILEIAAHDLRNPVTAVQLYSDFLINPPVPMDEEKKKIFLQRINDSSRYTVRLLNDLLDLEEIESGQIKINKERTDYVSLIKKNVEINRLIASQKDISIQVVAESEIEISLDRGKIEQVFTNLLSNAIKFSPLGSTITVVVEFYKEWVRTKVIDEGQGIPKEDQSVLFTKFGRTSVVATAGEKSTGLGLSISKEIVLAHDGSIGFVSEVGVGSNFYYCLVNE